MMARHAYGGLRWGRPEAQRPGRGPQDSAAADPLSPPRGRTGSRASTWFSRSGAAKVGVCETRLVQKEVCAPWAAGSSRQLWHPQQPPPSPRHQRLRHPQQQQPPLRLQRNRFRRSALNRQQLRSPSSSLRRRSHRRPLPRSRQPLPPVPSRLLSRAWPGQSLFLEMKGPEPVLRLSKPFWLSMGGWCSRKAGRDTSPMSWSSDSVAFSSTSPMRRTRPS